ncbi:MAG: type I polyketide synthase [Pseudomonadales bacterium]|nr:type I polyketide synthase [Pseudomonadales bacterium]
MADNNKQNLMRDALKQIKQLKKQLARYQKAANEPIAIVGMGCRYPDGANNPAIFWEKLTTGSDMICQQENNERWNMDEFYDPDPDAPGKVYTKGLGIIDTPDEFDAEFFGISPREAEDIDPQHRILLEVCQETIENAGYAASQLSGSRTGVYVGIASSDYAHLGSVLGSAEDLTPWQGIGNAMSAAPGRVSYLFNFKGPALAMDTACSSSLVALHSACQALRAGECDAALSGGVHLVLNPAVSIVFAKARMLAEDGRCKTFDADADGYVRSEGCGIVMLKRLSDAERDGDNILALIKGSAINQDGKSQGITAPNEAAQEAVIQAALEQAQLKPTDVSYVEAHGTGTPLGDPIELNALQAVYCENQVRQPLLVGAVKTNLGHCEAASGIAGVLKLIQSLQHQTIPPHINYAKPNPYVPWQKMSIKVTDQTTDWGPYKNDAGKLRGGVSSFAFTGTNAHIILENYVPVLNDEEESDSLEGGAWVPPLVVSSAFKPEAVRQWRDSLVDYLEQHPATELVQVCRTTTAGRDHYKFRHAWLPNSLQDLTQLLQNDANLSDQSSKTLQGEKLKASYKIAFMFSDQQANYQSTQQILYKRIAAYRNFYDDVVQAVKIVRQAEDLDTDLSKQGDTIGYFAFQYALTKCWLHWGVKPDFLLGDSVGELCAATIAGVFSLDDACTLVFARQAWLVGERNETATKTFVDAIANIKFKTPRLRVFSNRNGEHLGREMASADYWASQLGETAAISEACKNLLSTDVDVVLEMGMGKDLIGQLGRINELISQNVQESQQTISKLSKLKTFPCIDIGDTENTALDSLTRCLANCYVSGLDLNWQQIMPTQHCQSLALPTYPFQRKSFFNQKLRDYYLSQRKDLPTTAKQWLYQLCWEVTENLDFPLCDQCNWLLLFPTFSSAQEFAPLIATQGEQVTLGCFNIDKNSVSVTLEGHNEADNPSETLTARGDVSGLLLGALAQSSEEKPTRVVVSFAGLDLADNPALSHELTLWLLTLAKTVQQASHVKLHLITESAQGVAERDCLIKPEQALVTGVAKNLMLELADKMQTVLDVDQWHSASMGQVAEVLRQQVAQPWLALRNHNWYSATVKTFEPETLKLDTGANVSTNIKADSFYLVPGGTGAIGLRVAQWLGQRGAKHIALLSRRGIQNDQVQEQVDLMRHQGVQVIVAAVDLANAESLKSVLENLRRERPIAGVFHTAGQFDITPLQNLTAEQCHQLMDNKVLGMQYLDELTASDPLDYFVGFSSIASVWGSAGNFHYAAANQVVDAVVARRRQQGKPGLVINWGPWEDSGMVSVESKQQAEKRGLITMAPDIAIKAFAHLLASGQGAAIVADIDWQRFKPLMAITPVGHLFDQLEIPATQVAQTVELNEEDLAFKAALAECAPEERQEKLLDYLKLQLGKALQLMADEVDDQQPLIDMGIDSLMAVEFKNRVTQVTDVELPIVRLLGGAHLADVAFWMTEAYNQQAQSLANSALADEEHTTQDALMVEGVL